MNTIIQINRQFVSFDGLVDQYTRAHAVFIPRAKAKKLAILSMIAEQFKVSIDDLILLA